MTTERADEPMTASSLPSVVLGARVLRAPVATALRGAVRVSPWMQTTRDETLLSFPRSRVLVRGSDEVVIDCSRDDEASIAPQLYGVVSRLVLLHAGVFTLHASLVAGTTGGVVVGGAAGAGKSTTCAALSIDERFRLVIDDVVPVTVRSCRAIAEPFVRPVHLGEHNARAFEAGSRITAEPGRKVAVDVAIDLGPTPIDRLVWLKVGEPDRGSPVEVRELRGAARIEAVLALSNATGLSAMFGRAAAFFAWVHGVASTVPMTEVVRPASADTLQHVCAVIESLPGARGTG